MSTPEADTREITFAEAIREALAEELRRDARVFILADDEDARIPAQLFCQGFADRLGKRDLACVSIRRRHVGLPRFYPGRRHSGQIPPRL